MQLPIQVRIDFVWRATAETDHRPGIEHKSWTGSGVEDDLMKNAMGLTGHGCWVLWLVPATLSAFERTIRELILRREKIWNISDNRH
jgi:hypothetical protein